MWITELILLGRTCPGSGSRLRLGGPDWYWRSVVVPAVEGGEDISLCEASLEKLGDLGQIFFFFSRKPGRPLGVGIDVLLSLLPSCSGCPLLSAFHHLGTTSRDSWGFSSYPSLYSPVSACGPVTALTRVPHRVTTSASCWQKECCLPANCTSLVACP